MLSALLLAAARQLETARRRTRARYLPGGVLGRDVRGPAGRRRRCAGGGQGRARRAAVVLSRARLTRCWMAAPCCYTEGYPAAMPISRRALRGVLPRGRLGRGGAALALARVAHRGGSVGRRELARPVHPSREDRSPGWRAQRASPRAQLTRLCAPVRRRASERRVAGRGAESGQGSDGSNFAPYGALALAALSGREGRGRRADRRPI